MPRNSLASGAHKRACAGGLPNIPVLMVLSRPNFICGLNITGLGQSQIRRIILYCIRVLIDLDIKTQSLEV